MKKFILFCLILLLTTKSYSQYWDCTSGNCENGYGTIVEPSGFYKYVGYFKNFKMDGLGTYYTAVLKEGWIKTYVGNWKNGKRNGFGKSYTTVDRSLKYEGNWKDDEEYGKGSYYLKSGGQVYTRASIDGEWDLAKEEALISEKEFSYKKYIKNVKPIEESGSGCISGNCVNGYGVKIIKKYGDEFQYSGWWKNSKKDGYGITVPINDEQNEYIIKAAIWKNGLSDTFIRIRQVDNKIEYIVINKSAIYNAEWQKDKFDVALQEFRNRVKIISEQKEIWYKNFLARQVEYKNYLTERKQHTRSIKSRDEENLLLGFLGIVAGAIIINEISSSSPASSSSSNYSSSSNSSNSRTQECYSCGNSGWKECISCNGTGKKLAFLGIGRTDEACNSCGGRGTQRCKHY